MRLRIIGTWIFLPILKLCNINPQAGIQLRLRILVAFVVSLFSAIYTKVLNLWLNLLAADLLDS